MAGIFSDQNLIASNLLSLRFDCAQVSKFVSCSCKGLGIASSRWDTGDPAAGDMRFNASGAADAAAAGASDSAALGAAAFRSSGASGAALGAAARLFCGGSGLSGGDSSMSALLEWSPVRQHYTPA